ncbi:hypothetical protein C8R44DRAFT_846316 [Mycena epipterygia]|nr:hypothetical protein C8R44DRAFT_846316 [Mycena epipterygia]
MRLGTPFVLLAWALATSGVLAAPLEGDRDHGLVARAVSSAKPKPAAPSTTAKPSKSAAPLSRSSAVGPSSVKSSAPSGKPSAVSAKPSSASGSPSVVASSAKVSASSIKGSSVASGPSSVASSPASPSGSGGANNIPGPSACAVGSKPSGSGSVSAKPSGSASVSKRGSSLAARSAAPATPSDPACKTPATCKVKGQSIWNSITAATADTSKDKTTTKFQKSYPAIFSGPKSINKDISSTNDDLAKEIRALFNEGADEAALERPLFPGLASTMKRVANEDEDAYEFVFAPGVIVAVRSYKNLDPVTPASAQVSWDVVAMESYKAYKGTSPPTDLKYIVRFHIANSLSNEVLKDLYTNGGMEDQLDEDDTEWVKWDPTDASCGLPAVLTLLGTDNGSGAGFLLVDYHTTLGGKKLKAMYTRKSDGDWGMITEYA